MSSGLAVCDFAGQIFGASGPHIAQLNYLIAGRSVRVRCASTAISDRLGLVFGHLVKVNPDCDGLDSLTIWAWDDSAAEAKIPEPTSTQGTSGIIFNGGISMYSYDIVTRRMEVYDSQRRLGLFRVPDARLLSAHDQAAPFLRLFHWWSLNEGLHLVHGAAVGTRDGAALLVGRSGSGKSTTALSCVGTCLQYLGDDTSLIEPGLQPMVHSLFSSGKADPRSMSMLPYLAGEFEPALNDDKSVVFLAKQHASALLTSAPLRAIVVPVIGGNGRWEASPVAPEIALRALAPSTIFQMPGGRAESLSRMAALVRAIPCWTLRLGSDTDAAAPALLDIIKRSGSS